MRGRGGGYIAQHSGIEGVWLAWGLGGTPPHGRERSGLILRSRPEAEPLRKRVGSMRHAHHVQLPGRSVTVPVIERGPYVAGAEWDLTGAAAEALAFPGLCQIEWTVVG